MSFPLTFHTVQTPRDLREFLDMPLEVYRTDPNWVQPLYSEEEKRLGSASPFFRHGEARLRIARDARGRAVGRISTQWDTLAPKSGDRPEGHFGFIEAVDADVMRALLADAEPWFRERGITRVVGPFSLSINDESGLLVEGPDAPPRLMMNYAPAWYGPAIESAGYTKAKDLLAFLLDLQKELPPGAVRMAAQASTIPGFRERTVRMDCFAEELRSVGDIFNDAWSANWGYVPLTPEEVAHLGKGLKPLVNPELVRFIEIDGKPIGMVVALEDLFEALRGLKGRLLPFGWLRLLWRLKVKRVTAARVILMGVNRAWQGDIRNAAMVAAMFVALQRALVKHGYRQLEMSWVLEDNKPTTALAKLFGAVVEKRYRLYQKQLS